MKLRISKDITDILPKYLINLLQYIWETESEHQQVMFRLVKSDVSAQNIIICADGKKVKTITIPLDNPVEIDVAFTKYAGGFTMVLP